MPGISIHVVDVTRGIVAAGMLIEVHALSVQRTLIARAPLSMNGTLDDPALAVRFTPGEYEAAFHVANFYRDAGAALPSVPFLDVVTFRFGIADPDQHYHLPMKVTPWGFSCFRGGT